MATRVTSIVKEEASWEQIRQWDQLRGDMETSIARALQAKLTRLKEKKWLEECEKEMGWGRAAAYYHLNPAQMEKHRDDSRAAYAAAQRPHNVDIDTGATDTNKPAEDEGEEWVEGEVKSSFNVDIRFSQFLESVKDHPADEYLQSIHDTLQKAANRRRFTKALTAAKTWIETVLAGIEQLDNKENRRG